ncbi:MAG: hypothetical protein HY247_07950 [archaeon]|nr:MAG: hypothetical protein HY247_07950 [archaeon]
MEAEKVREAAILEAHQELVAHIESGANRMRTLSALTIAVSILLALAYSSQLLAPIEGTTAVLVDLTNPVLRVTEVFVLVLALLWLYVGLRDYRFSSRMRKEIGGARAKERDIEERVAGQTK